MNEYIYAIAGGLLIGLAASLMLVLNGRITGISGIASTVLNLLSNPAARRANQSPTGLEVSWRILFMAGLLLGGILLANFTDTFKSAEFSQQPLWLTIAAGLLVGFGTRLGLGCTSGHGVCGIARLSLRSVIATIIFMAAGILTVAFVNFLQGN